MKFLLDHDVYGATARFLTGSGHEIVQTKKGTVKISWAEPLTASDVKAQAPSLLPQLGSHERWASHKSSRDYYVSG
jgi:hypothetical protein